MRVKGAALAWLEPNLPHADRRILEPQLRPDVEVLRRSLQLLGVVVRIEGLLGDHSGGHAVLLGLSFSWTGAVECWFQEECCVLPEEGSADERFGGCRAELDGGTDDVDLHS